MAPQPDTATSPAAAAPPDSAWRLLIWCTRELWGRPGVPVNAFEISVVVLSADASGPPAKAQRAGRGLAAADPAALAAEHEGDADRDGPARDRPDQVGPPRAPVVQHQGRAERPGRVHGGAADGGAPQAGQGDVAADAERGQRPELLRAGGGALDNTDQPGGQDD